MQSWMDNDREVLARTLIAEAGNQGPLGMLAAGSVIMNRARTPGYGAGVRGVIMKPGQFSPWNSVTGYAGGEQGQDMAAIRPTSEAYEVADRLLSGQYEDPTGGATHFYNPDISTPSWGQAAGGNWSRIGSHVFGRADAGRNGTGGSMQPQGLLGTMSTRSAPEQERLPFFQRPETADLLDRLTVGFGGLTMRPNQALIQSAQESLSSRREERKTTAQRNATIDLLRRQKRDDLIAAVEGGLPITEALKLALTPTEPGYSTLTGAQLNAQYGTAFPETDLFNRSGSGQVTKVGGAGMTVQVGGPTSPGWEAVDKKFAETWIDWTSGGGADAMKQIAQLRSVADRLATGEPITGPVLGLQPDVLQSLFSPEALNARQQVEEVVQRNLRAVLGSQFTQAEGDRLIARAFDQRLSPQQNAARLSVLIQQMEAAAQAKASMVNYFGQKGTLQGFEAAGAVPTIADFEATLDALDRRMGVDTRLRPSMSGDDAVDILLGQ